MARGDHLFVHRLGYTHHAIDLGAGRVVHYGRGILGGRLSEVEIVSWDDFSSGLPVGIHNCCPAFDAETTVTRALGRLGERRYDLLENNCEHFVHWCRCGRHESWQADRLRCRVNGAAAKLAAQQAARPWICWATRRVATASLARAVRCSTTPWLLVADGAQWAVEWAVATRGGTAVLAERLGRSVNAGLSAAIGAAVGGPAGAAVGLGMWAAGEAACAGVDGRRGRPHP
jgi:hypothetical protein